MFCKLAFLVLIIFFVQYTNAKNKSSTSASYYYDSLRPEGLLHMKIEKFSEFIKKPTTLTSELVFIQGLPWKLLVQSHENSDCFSCYLQCNGEDTDNGWSCASGGKIQLLGSNSKEFKKGWKKHTFSAKKKELKSTVCKFETIMDPENGLYDKQHDSLIIEVEIRAELPQGLKYPPIRAMVKQATIGPARERDDSLANRMRSLWQNSEDTDIKFLVGRSEDNKQLIKAHKTVLSSASDVFRTMFRFDKEQKKVLKVRGGKDADATKKTPIVVDDVGADAFRVMLNYIYTDDIKGLNIDNLFDVMKAADKYNITGLLQVCADNPILEPNNVLVWLNRAYLSGAAQMFDSAKSLIRRCWDFVDQNIYAVINNDQFLHIDQDLLTELLGRKELMMSRKGDLTDYGEIALWHAVLRWTDEQCRQSGMSECTGQNRRRILGQALFKIRFTLMEQADFAKEIVQSGVLKKDEMLSVLLYYAHPDHGFPGLYPLKFCTDTRA